MLNYFRLNKQTNNKGEKMKNKITTIGTTALVTLLLGSQAANASEQVAMISEKAPSGYELYLSNGQTAEVFVVKKIKFINKKTEDISIKNSIFNLDDGP